jgi:Tol biopolymer transport system component
LDENNRLIQDNVGGDITISCDPPSGSVFPIGDTTVECTATDEAGNIGRALFTVTVNPVESPRENGKIAFMSTRDGNWEIYVMNADGTNPTRLTNNDDLDQDPDWSPDGEKIVFISDRDGNTEIYVMNADGTGQTRLTNTRSFELAPVWSPDGTKIAFIRDNNIIVMNADGTGQTRLTNDVNNNNPQ